MVIIGCVIYCIPITCDVQIFTVCISNGTSSLAKFVLEVKKNHIVIEILYYCFI